MNDWNTVLELDNITLTFLLATSKADVNMLHCSSFCDSDDSSSLRRRVHSVVSRAKWWISRRFSSNRNASCCCVFQSSNSSTILYASSSSRCGFTAIAPAFGCANRVNFGCCAFRFAPISVSSTNACAMAIFSLASFSIRIIPGVHC